MRTQSFLLPAALLAIGLSTAAPALAQRHDGGNRGHGRGGEYRGGGPRGGDWRGGDRYRGGYRGDPGRRGGGYGYGAPLLGGALLGLGLGAVLGGVLAPQPPAYAPPPGVYYPPGKPDIYDAPPPAYYGY